MKRKFLLLFALSTFLFAITYHSTSIFPQKITIEKSITDIESEMKKDGTTLKNDFRESIMVFVEEGVPIDSLYIPDWLNPEED